MVVEAVETHDSQAVVKDPLPPHKRSTAIVLSGMVVKQRP